jgi:hypothetical protein
MIASATGLKHAMLAIAAFLLIAIGNYLWTARSLLRNIGRNAETSLDQPHQQVS